MRGLQTDLATHSDPLLWSADRKHCPQSTLCGSTFYNAITITRPTCQFASESGALKCIIDSMRLVGYRPISRHAAAYVLTGRFPVEFSAICHSAVHWVSVTTWISFVWLGLRVGGRLAIFYSDYKLNWGLSAGMRRERVSPQRRKREGKTSWTDVFS